VPRYEYHEGAAKMLDLTLLVLVGILFILSIGYVYACDRL
jgi:hypothetical protein